MPITSHKPVHFVDQQDGLVRCIEALRRHPVVAFDLEFDSHHHAYGTTLCLIQVASPDACYVIDPFADMDLEEVYLLFEDEQIQKIVHAPGEDLRLLHSLKCYPQNVFDTEVVARLLNYEQTSLAALLQEKLGQTLSKQQQKSNWLRRPLSQEQIAYAALDVASLHQLKAMLVAEAGAKGLMPFVEEEQELLSTIIHQPEARENFLKPADKYLSPRHQHVLNALLVYRDRLGRKINKPAFQVMGEELVRGLAAGTLQPYDVINEPGIHRHFRTTRFADELADELEDIYARAAALHLSDEPPPKEIFTPEQQAARTKANRDRTQKFQPIQQALADRYGANAARLMLSTNAVNDLLAGTQTIGGIRQAYRRSLIQEVAAAQGIDLSDYQ